MIPDWLLDLPLRYSFSLRAGGWCSAAAGTPPSGSSPSTEARNRSRQSVSRSATIAASVFSPIVNTARRRTSRQNRSPVLFLDQLLAGAARDVGQDQIGELLPRRQLHQKLAVRPLAGRDEGGAGIGPVHPHRVRQPIREDVVPLDPFFGDDRLGHGTRSRRVAGRAGLHQRDEKVAPRHVLLRSPWAVRAVALGAGQTRGSKPVYRERAIGCAVTATPSPPPPA